MTGFGSAEVIENGAGAKVEVHSVNGRFLDLKMKLPKYFYEYEGELRKIAQEYIERGRVNISITITMTSERVAAVNMDYDLAARYLELTDELSRRHGIENRMDARTLLALPDILSWGDDDPLNEESHWDMARRAAIAALEAHRAMRAKEGEAIGRDVKRRLETINRHLGKIEKITPEIIRMNTVRLRKKIESLIGSDAVDDARFAMEVAIYADRLDVTEECVRFRSHNAIFAQELAHKKTSGRKLSFLLQEMNRETNTIGSKIMAAEVTAIVVLIKEELEKMREQAENME